LQSCAQEKFLHHKFSKADIYKWVSMVISCGEKSKKNNHNDVLVINNELWISDTNNDRLIKFNLVNKQKEIVRVSDDGK